MTNHSNVANLVDEPSTIAWVLTVLAGLLWILIRRALCVPFRRRSDGSPIREGWWAQLRRYLPSWPRRPNLVLLVLSPSSSRSQLHDEAPDNTTEGTSPSSAHSPPSNEIVTFHFESNTSHHSHSRRRRKAFSLPPEGVS
jgi:hypothetical protein